MSNDENKKSDVKGWIGAITGVVSLIISSLLAYKTVLYQHDLVYVTTNVDHYTLSAKGSDVSFSYTLTAIMTNAGTTNVTISNVETWLRHVPKQISNIKDCEAAQPKAWNELHAIGFNPLTIKPNETTSIKLQFEGNPSLFRDANETRGAYSYGAFCSELRFTYLTDQTEIQHVPVSSSEYAIGIDYGPATYPGGNFFGDKPYPLVDKRRWFAPL